MRTVVWVLVGLAALAAGFDSAKADDGCGRGRYYNGYRCAPIDSQEYYGPPGYSGRPPAEYYPPGAGPRARGRGDYGAQSDYNKDCYTVNGRRICCPKQWTVQDGVCKPYKGR